MHTSPGHSGLQKTTPHKIVLPFYGFAAFSFLISCYLLFADTEIVHQHYFHPHTLAITHLMALGWGTMIILGASHQLLPVLIEGKLSSVFLGHLSFICTALGIPILVVSFYIFHTGWLMHCGAILVNAGVAFYLVNVVSSILENKRRDVYACYMLTASLWLITTTFFGLLLVFNFSRSWLPQSSFEYLTLHAHFGILGWFLLLIIGVGSRLLPMFLISKYTDSKTLWWIYIFINSALMSFIVIRFLAFSAAFVFLPIALVLAALLLFLRFIYSAYKVRIRKQVDGQMKLSLLSVALLFIPLFSLLITMLFNAQAKHSQWGWLYGFCIFFGWITAIILGMTFKTLPFIVWSKVYQNHASSGTPIPKDLYSEKWFKLMAILYLIGYILFFCGILILNNLLLKCGAGALLAAAIFYVLNLLKTINHQPKT